MFDSPEFRAGRHTCAKAARWIEAGSVSGYLVEELAPRQWWPVGERLRFLGWELQAPPDRPGGGEVGDEGEDLDLATAERAQQPSKKLKRVLQRRRRERDSQQRGE